MGLIFAVFLLFLDCFSCLLHDLMQCSVLCGENVAFFVLGLKEKKRGFVFVFKKMFMGF